MHVFTSLQTKCEHYWPAQGETRLQRGLTITTASEQRHTDWTLREFRVKHVHDTLCQALDCARNMPTELK